MESTMTKPRFLSLVIGAALALLPAVAPVSADVVLTGSDNVYSDGEIDGTGGPVVLQTSGDNTGYFDFADPNNDDDEADAITDGLNLQGNYLERYASGSSDVANTFRLDLNGGAITGTSGSFIRTRNSPNCSTAYLRIINAGSIQVGALRTQVDGVAKSGGIYVDHSGNFTATELDVYAPGSSLAFYNNYGVRVHGDGTGSFTVNSIMANNHMVGYGIDIQYYTSVTVTATLTGNCVYKFGSRPDVVISNIGAGGITVPTTTANNDSMPKDGFDDDNVSDIRFSTTGPITVNGTLYATVAATVSSYTEVRGGNITLLAGGDILVTGTVDGNCAHTVGSSHDGDALLKTTGVNSTITVGYLNLDRVRYADFDCAGGVSHITGVLSNFTGKNDASLRVPEGQTIYYDPKLNPSLNGATYQLRNLAGTPDSGGMLQAPPRGTTVVFR